MPPAADCLFSQAWISNLPRIGLLVFLVTTPSLELPADEIDFVRDIRPILSDKCYTCHGPDEAQRQANLRLDTQSGAFAESDGHHAIVAGNVNDSELLRRVEANDDSIMPPPDYKKHLTEREKEILRSWIAQGASWKDHWAYLPLQEPTPPETGSSWPFNSIDQFILHKLTSQNVTPATDADRRTLIRRLSFDLIGLPPTPQQVDEFLKDPSSDAYERVVDRLLESPHYGERMAMVWLDLVRYADSVGYHGDQDVSVSPYRDYVIKAFNENYSFDRFTREQLAGDLLPNPTHEQLIASGYNKLGMMSAEGGVQPEEYLTKYASDRVRTAAGVWMGSTFGCAECHDHKFDPFTTKDFYRFAAFFADIKERGLYDGPATAERWGPIVEVPDEGLDELLAPIDSRIAELETQFGASSPEIDALQKQWQESLRLDAQRWFVLIPQ
ncbi:MAG: DUF1549 domain-containing protein, partial [Planctomycetaceae bacterium]|nr:DUF1549 domain-containing protein [Planctomycetaceae bacterium]